MFSKRMVEASGDFFTGGTSWATIEPTVRTTPVTTNRATISREERRTLWISNLVKMIYLANQCSVPVFVYRLLKTIRAFTLRSAFLEGGHRSRTPSPVRDS